MLMPSRVTPADAPGDQLGADAASTDEEPGNDPAAAPGADAGRVRRWLHAPRPHWVRELVLMGSLYAAYSLIRNLAPDRHVVAQENARAILDAVDRAGDAARAAAASGPVRPSVRATPAGD